MNIAAGRSIKYEDIAGKCSSHQISDKESEE